MAGTPIHPRGSAVTDLLDRTRALPPDAQDEAACMLLLFPSEAEPMFPLTPEEEADLAASEADANRGEFATDVEMQAIFAKHI